MSGSSDTLGMRAVRAGGSAVLVVLMMVIGSLVLWVGVPLGWLWVGSQIQASGSDKIGTAIFVMMIGVLVSVLLLAKLLVRLNMWQESLREASGRPQRDTPLLERVLVVTAGLAVVAFGVWFFIFTGPGPSLAPSN